MFTMVTLGSWQQTKLLQNRRVVCSQGLRASDSFLPAVVHHRLQDLTTEQIEQCIAWYSPCAVRVHGQVLKNTFCTNFEQKILWFVSQSQCFVFLYFLGWQVQSCKYVNVNNCQLSATSLSSVQPPTNTLNIKNKQTSNILLFQFYYLLLDKVGDFVRSWSGLRAAWRRISWRLWIILWHHFFITIAFLGHEALKTRPKPPYRQQGLVGGIVGPEYSLVGTFSLRGYGAQLAS